MSTNAKVGIAVALLVALVFGATILSQLPTGGGDDGTGTGGSGAETPKEGLTQYVAAMGYHPDAGRAEYRHFQQFFETGEHTIPFWVSNRTSVPITVIFAHTDCTQCSLAEVAVVPGLTFDPEGDPDPFGAIVGGIAGQAAIGPDDPPFGLNDVAYRARQRIEAAVAPADWVRLKPPGSTRDDVRDDKPGAVIPAGSPEKPTWAIIRLNVKFTASKELVTRFDCVRADSPVALPMGLGTRMQLVEACDVYPRMIDFRTMPETVREREETVYFWSATRSINANRDSLLAPLPPPDVKAVRVPHISFTPPVPLTPAEAATFARQISPQPTKDAPNPPVLRVAGAYKTILRFNRDGAAGKTGEAALGPFEQSVGLTPDGGGMTLTKTPTVTVRANLIGVVRLVEAQQNVKDDKIALGTFSVRSDLRREVTLTSDEGIELEMVRDQTKPAYLKLGDNDTDTKLTSKRVGDRLHWTVTLRIDKGVGGGALPQESMVVLRIKNTGQLVRIPVTGSGTN